jgi:hypothetical protein
MPPSAPLVLRGYSLENERKSLGRTYPAVIERASLRRRCVDVGRFGFWRFGNVCLDISSDFKDGYHIIAVGYLGNESVFAAIAARDDSNYRWGTGCNREAPRGG